MKQLKQAIAVVALLMASTSMAQTGNDFQAGSITSFSNETSTGSIKPMFKARGAIIFQNTSQQKQQLSPNEVSAFTLGTENYVSHTNDFYKVVAEGNKAQLLQRVTNNGGKVYYNGAQPVNTPSLEGKSGDFYIVKKGTNEPILISGPAFQRNAIAVFGDCSSITGALASKTVDGAALKNLVDQYNQCK